MRRRDRGYQALSTGMVAAGAGDGVLARKMNKQAAKLIRSETEPLIQLLDAQASLLEGDHETARDKFEAMLDDPEMRLLGLRGLYLEAERLGDRTAARHYAGRAAEAAPHLAWAANATIEERAARGDWDGALKLVESQKATRQIERDAANRRRAVLLTAKAQALFDTDPTASRNAALEANKLLPGFAPAAVAAAKALFKHNDLRKGAKILEAAWRADAHPDVGALYVHARPGDAVNDRLYRARKLQSMKQNNAESALLVARAALEAGDYKAAREAAEAAVADGAARRRLPVARRYRGGRQRRSGPRAAVSLQGGARAARSGLGGGRRRVGAMGAGVSGHRPPRCVRVAGSGRAARPTDRVDRGHGAGAGAAHRRSAAERGPRRLARHARCRRPDTGTCARGDSCRTRRRHRGAGLRSRQCQCAGAARTANPRRRRCPTIPASTPRMQTTRKRVVSVCSDRRINAMRC